VSFTDLLSMARIDFATPPALPKIVMTVRLFNSIPPLFSYKLVYVLEVEVTWTSATVRAVQKLLVLQYSCNHWNIGIEKETS
jgi:hypothetical protein